MATARLRAAAGRVPAGACDPALRPLFEELGQLKRIRSAGRAGSIASRLFACAWGELAAGDDPRRVAARITQDALAAARLGDIDRDLLRAATLSRSEADAVIAAAVDAVSAALPAGLRSELSESRESERPGPAPLLPAFVAALDSQPRAGVTCPGRPRIFLEPPESHAEHCLVVAVYGVLLAPTYEADLATVFLAGLAHHLHNAALPDSGFTGEMLLGPHLEPVMEHFTRRALAELDAPLRRRVEGARRILPDAATPEGRAFHAADTIDRVLEIAHHLEAATLTMDRVLGEMGLVHEGPVKVFQDKVLREMAIP